MMEISILKLENGQEKDYLNNSKSGISLGKLLIKHWMNWKLKNGRKENRLELAIQPV
jgi:hypothetical protein